MPERCSSPWGSWYSGSGLSGRVRGRRPNIRGLRREGVAGLGFFRRLPRASDLIPAVDNRYWFSSSEGSQARPTAPDLRSGPEGVRGFESHPSHVVMVILE